MDGGELFVHRSYLKEAMPQGSLVDFEVEWVEKRQQEHAKDVRLAEKAAGDAAARRAPEELLQAWRFKGAWKAC